MAETTVTREEVRTVMCPAEDIVAASVPALRAAMRHIVEGGCPELVIDLTHVEMVDSSGIGLLISAHNSLHKRGGRLAAIHASIEILDLFRSMRIHQHFRVSGD